MSKSKIERRLWRCPFCNREYRIPANADDPMACRECAPSKQDDRTPDRSDQAAAVSRQPKSRSPIWEFLRQNAFVVGGITFLVLVLLAAKWHRWATMTPMERLAESIERGEDTGQVVVTAEQSLEGTQRFSDERAEERRRLAGTQNAVRSFDGQSPPAQQWVEGVARTKPKPMSEFEKQMAIRKLENAMRQGERAEAIRDLNQTFMFLSYTVQNEEFGYTTVIGEIKNDSANSYTSVAATANARDVSGRLIGTAVVALTNVSAYSVKSFTTAFKNVPARAIATVEIQFDAAF